MGFYYRINPVSRTKFKKYRNSLAAVIHKINVMRPAIAKGLSIPELDTVSKLNTD